MGKKKLLKVVMFKRTLICISSIYNVLKNTMIFNDQTKDHKNKIPRTNNKYLERGGS